MLRDEDACLSMPVLKPGCSSERESGLQITDSLEWLLARFSTLKDPQSFVRSSLVRCPQLLTAPRSQLEAAISFLEFLNLSTEEVCFLLRVIILRCLSRFYNASWISI